VPSPNPRTRGGPPCWPSPSVKHLYKAVYTGGVPPQTPELAHLRASQVNGCSAYVDAGVKSATKADISPEKLLAVAA